MTAQPRLPFDDAPQILPGRRLAATVAATLVASGADFVTAPTERLALDFEGVAGDFHRGLTRRSGGREPWYPRRTELRNERQVSIVALDELAAVASAMGLAAIRPEWIGANLVLDGLPRLSMLPAGTLLFFAGGATLKVDGQNRPCRLAGRSITRHAGLADAEEGALAFVRAARRLRGVVAWVEKPGAVLPGESVAVRVPEQWIY